MATPTVATVPTYIYAVSLNISNNVMEAAEEAWDCTPDTLIRADAELGIAYIREINKIQDEHKEKETEYCE